MNFLLPRGMATAKESYVTLFRGLVGCLLGSMCCTTVIGCGGGGGGPSASAGNPAAALIRVEPRKIDSGDRALVTVELRDIRIFESNGMIIKTRIPPSLDFLTNTSILSIQEESDIVIAPLTFANNEEQYILFYIDMASIPSNRREADITFLLEGTVVISPSTVAVDVDVADRDDRQTFSISNPRFTALSSTTVEVQ
jgi:hypothetical protein